ncbi:hypothetical protein VN97_g11728 [Penicillium thymicola]|uniref:Uncharacterized protein n=1 Tax=Penicillium thymicola TaxID=293382 RepID=A0AAI9X339_PENTH|nr:hypothetical protein VN97_g11728 [Penicillium thymicola]
MTSITPSQESEPYESALQVLWTQPGDVSEPTFERIKHAVESQPSENRYDLQLEVGEHLLKIRDENTEAVSRWYDYVIQSGAWKKERTETGFREEWDRARQVHDRYQQNLAYIQTTHERASLRWGEQDASSLFTMVHTKAIAEQVSKLLAKNVTFDQMRKAVNHELVRRLGRVGRGHRRTKHWIQGDFSSAAACLCTEHLPPSRFKQLGLKLDQHGFLVEKQGPPSPDLVSDEHDDDSSDDEGDSIVSMEEDSEPGTAGRPANQTDLPLTPPSTGVAKRKQKSRRFKGQAAHARYRQSYQSPTPKRPRTEPQPQCHCALSKSLLQQLKSAPTGPTDREKLITLRKTARVSGIFSAGKMCFTHAKALSGYLGLYTRQFTYSDLLGRLAYSAKQLDSWDKFRKEKPDWFTPQNFSGSVTRSSFRFKVETPLPRIARYIELGFNLADICTRIYGAGDDIGRQRKEEFEATGNVILPKLFGWLNDDISSIEGAASLSRMLGRPVVSLMQLIHLEFDMYDYHYTPAVARPRLGWSRNMFQSLTQQLTRQDVCYYAAYVAIRPDHAWRLMSFPYYAKSAYPGEETGFTHFDLNIGDYLATGRGGNAVQGSVSFTDEDRDNCTIILPRMHLHLREWWSRIEAHPDIQASAHTVVIYPWMWTKEDEDKFGTSFTGVVCQAGDVRLTLPVIPHGSTGPTTRLRRTIMPWFGVVHEDHERMETAEAGTWGEIADAHRDMSIGTRKPSGESSRKRSVSPYTFPGVSHLTGLGDLSDALLGRIRWSEWPVVAELDVLFGEDKEAAHSWILNWRRRAARQFIEAFMRIISAEKLAYGKRSYFHLLKEGLPIPEVHLQYQKDLGVDDVDDDTAVE